MSDFDVDLVVIGGGSGGVRAARIAANHGAKVVLAEEYRLGGTCVIRGCVPKKMFVYAGRVGDALEEAAEFGWVGIEPHFDWPTLIAGKDREISRLEGLYHASQMKAGVEVVKSRAVIEDPHTVRFLSDGRCVRTRYILIATGAKPEIPPWQGVELGITSNEVFDLKEFPKKLVIAGAGYIAIEFAGLFSSLGSDVTVVCRGSNVLRGFDEDLREALAHSYSARGIKFLFTDAISVIEPNPEVLAGARGKPRLRITTHNGARLTGDQVLLAVGRAPNTAEIGLEAVGVIKDEIGAIVVDPNSKTNIDNIYAVGDVTNRSNLTPVAIREGHAFADSVFGSKSWHVDYAQIPTAVFSTPEVGTIGLTEAQARLQLAHIDIYKKSFRTLKAEISGKCERTLVKIIVDAQSGSVCGVHLFAEGASELLQGIAVALKAGADVETFMSTMVVHPTIGEELGTMREPSMSYFNPRPVQSEDKGTKV